MNPIHIIMSRGGIWHFYLIPALLLSLPIWILGRRRARWMWWESSILVLPFFLFIALDYWHVKGGLGWTLITGSMYLSGVVPAALLVRVIVGQRANRIRLASILLIVSCLIAVVVYLLLPPSRTY